VVPYSLIKGILFKLGADEQLRRCLEESDQKKVIESLQSGSSGGHFASVNTVNRIRTAGYWWPYMNRDVKNFVDSCDQCQRTGTPSFRNHWPLTPIIPLAPFEKWGIDFIGPISPVSSQKKRYIILATDYATKWVEARATRKNDAQTSASFLFEEVMMRFGHPLELVSDRGTQQRRVPPGKVHISWCSNKQRSTGLSWKYKLSGYWQPGMETERRGYFRD
jgi:hypothetical protein